MEDSVNKFKMWLHKETEEVRKKIISSSIMEYGEELIGKSFRKVIPTEDIYENVRKNYKEDIEFLENVEFILNSLEKNPEEELNLCFFDSYSILNELFEKSELNSKEKWEIVVFLLEKNLKNYNEEAVSIEKSTLEKLIRSRFTEAQMNYLFFGSKDNIEENNKNTLTTIEKQEVDEFLMNMKFQKGSLRTCKAFTCIKRHFLNKKPNLNEGDIKITLKALQILGISKELCERFSYLLNKEKLKKQKEDVVKNNTIIKEEKSHYDYSALEKEVSQAIDLKDMYPKYALTLTERIYYLSILIKMNVSKEQRNLFLRNCELMYEERNPMLVYMETYNRLKYYEPSSGLQKDIAFMESCFQDMMLCSNEEYLFWKNSLGEELKQIEQWIPKNFEYEEVEAQRLLK